MAPVKIISNVLLNQGGKATKQQKQRRITIREKPLAVKVEPLEMSAQTCGANETRRQQNIANNGGRVGSTPYILNGELYKIITQDGDNVTVQCLFCPQDRVYRGSVRSTGNFHMHIKRRHPELGEKLHNMKVEALLARRESYHKIHYDRISQTRRSYRGMNINLPIPVKEEPTIGLIANGSADLNFNIPSTSSQILQQHHSNLKIKTTLLQRHNKDAQRNDIDMQAAVANEISNHPIQMMPLEVKLATLSDESRPLSNSSVEHRNLSNLLYSNSNITANGSILNNLYGEIKQEPRIQPTQPVLLQEEPLDLSAPNQSTNMKGINSAATVASLDLAIQNLQQTIQERNEIEKERLSIELAKFVFLHPSFRYERR